MVLVLHGSRWAVDIGDIVLAFVRVVTILQAALALNHSALLLLLVEHLLLHVLIEERLRFNEGALVHVFE